MPPSSSENSLRKEAGAEKFLTGVKKISKSVSQSTSTQSTCPHVSKSSVNETIKESKEIRKNLNKSFSTPGKKQKHIEVNYEHLQL